MKNQKKSDELTKKGIKKNYAAPHLKVYGDVSRLTKAMMPSGTDNYVYAQQGMS